MSIRTHYENLQVAENASPEVIRGAYRSLLQKWHPDKNPDSTAEAARKSSLIIEAYAVLSDHQRRKEHDLWIKSERERDAERITKDQLSPTPRTSKEAPITVTTSKTGVVKRVWLMVLFVASLAMILGVFPYQLIAREFRWEYIGGVAFWLWVGHYAYTALFHPEIIAEERRLEKEKRLSIKPTVLKGAAWGTGVGVAAFVLSAIALAGESGYYFGFGVFMVFLIAGALFGALGLRR